MTGQRDALAVNELDDAFEFGYDEGAGTDKGHFAGRRHEFGVFALFDLEVEAAHFQEGLRCQAVGIIGEEDLFHFVRLEELDVFRPWFLS